MHVERIFDIRLAAWLVVELRLDADALPVFFRQHVHLVRRTASSQGHAGLGLPPVGTQYLREELFKREARRAEREDGAFDGIPCGDWVRLFALEHIECMPVNLLRPYTRSELVQDARGYPCAYGRRGPHVFQGLFKLGRIERLLFSIGFGNKKFLGHALYCIAPPPKQCSSS